MILTTEQFWCPRCGRLPRTDSDMYVEPGLMGGWTTLTCCHCGNTDGDLVCSGDTEACAVSADGQFCRFHGNYTGQNPHPHGRARSQERAAREAAALARHHRDF